MRTAIGQPMNLSDILGAGVGAGGPAPDSVPPDADAARLRTAFDAFLQRHEFQEGQLVREKEALRTLSRVRTPTNVFVVLQLVAVRLTTEEAFRLGVFGSDPDIVLGYYDVDGDFVFTCASSLRFEPIGDAELAEMTTRFKEANKREEPHAFVSEGGTGQCDVCGESFAAHGQRRPTLRDHLVGPLTRFGPVGDA